MKFIGDKLIGLVAIALLVGGVALTGAIFTKAFTDYTEVTLRTSSIGLQMPERADVKIRGVIVGEVLDFEARNGEGNADITLGIFSDKTDLVPANVTARIEPKTLFGEKFVALQVPDQPSSESISADDVITQTEVATEVEEALNDLFPLLRAVQPADLNRSLNAIATALEGRGERIGENLETLDSYLKRMNPLLPEFVENIRSLGQTSELYADVIPEIAATLRDQTTTGQTLLTREEKLMQLFQDVAAFSGTTERFLDENGDNLVRVNQLGAQQLRVFAKYAPEFPCLASGIVNAGVRQAEAFRGFTLHINLELIPNQPRPYGPQDAPRFGAKNGPYCGQLPTPSYNQQNVAPPGPPGGFDDGVDEPTGKGTTRVAPGFGAVATAPGTAAERRMIQGLVAASSGKPASEVSDLSVLLLAPMLRGAEVTLR